MTKITAFLVKILRERTGAGIMDCKKVLIETNGNIELAVEKMQKYGFIKATRKANKIVTNGVIKTKINKNYGVILEINCETDFAARGNSLQLFADKIINLALTKKITDTDILRMTFEGERVALAAKIGENINIRRIASLEGDVIGHYLHDMRIGVLVAAKNTDKELAKKIAMHIAASNPKVINPRDVSIEMIKKEHQTQLENTTQSAKSKDITEKIINGRTKKIIDEVSLINQIFIIDHTKTVGQFLEENNADIVNFIRFELGESA